ncbi:MAG TPA: carbonic anhydrase [Streptosporangiaceae bacterium]|jgi:carbonic anhydrase|nr:carbonic anhydrase [Streptosporangiaceae bacterium]
MVNAQGAWEKLKLGNEHWVAGKLEHPNQTVERRVQTAKHQDPFAVVFGCIDSRVPPEIVFDQGIGDLFVIRTGAQVLDQGIVLGSVEFGPNGYPSARLIVVLGHTECGAVTAAYDHFKNGTYVPEYITAVVDALRPAYLEAEGKPGDPILNMVHAQVQLTVDKLTADPLLAELIKEQGLQIVGGVYHLVTGRVQRLDEPDPA